MGNKLSKKKKKKIENVSQQQTEAVESDCPPKEEIEEYVKEKPVKMMLYTEEELVSLFNDIQINAAIFDNERITMWKWQYVKFFNDYQVNGYKLYNTGAKIFADELHKMYKDTITDDQETKQDDAKQFKDGAVELYQAFIDTIEKIELNEIDRPKYISNKQKEQLDLDKELSLSVERIKIDKEAEESITKEENVILQIERNPIELPQQIQNHPLTENPRPFELKDFKQDNIQIWFEHGSKFRNIKYKNVMKRFFEWRKTNKKIDGQELLKKKQQTNEWMTQRNDQYMESVHNFHEYDLQIQGQPYYSGFEFITAAEKTREAFNDYYKPTKKKPYVITIHLHSFVI